MDAMKNLLLAGLGAIGYAKDSLQSTVDSLVDKGDLTREQAEKVIASWVERGKSEQDDVSAKVGEEARKVVNKLHLVTREDLDALTARVEELEKRVGG